MRHAFIVLLVAGLSAGILAQAPQSASPDVLLKAAMQKEQIDNDLPAAIAQYQAIVEKFPKDAAAPKALLQLAGIYARKGDVGAEREAYERIARDYPDSGAPASAAKQRLGTATASRFKETELIPTGRADAMLGTGRVSPDGRYISFDDSLITTAGGTGNLAMWEIASDKSTIVNRFSNQVPWAEGWSEGSAWSPDSKLLAYAWRVRDAGMQLRTVDIRTGRHQVIYNVPDGWGWFKPMAWSPDRRRIAVAMVIKAAEVKRREPAWSPDGARIAYVQSAPGVPESIVVQTVATNDVRVYPVSVRNIDWPLWQRDGRAFIFDGTGGDNVQRTFKLDLGTGRVEAFGDAVVFGMSPDGQAVYEGGNTKGLVRRNLSDNSTSVLLPPGVGPGGGRTLSPDGRWFAFLRPTRPGARVERPGRSLFIQSASGGEERVLVSDFRAGYARLAWTPDSRFVICEVAPNGLHRVPIDGGAPQSLDVKGLGMITEKSMNADGRRLAFAISRNRTELWVWENVLPKGR